MKKRLLCKIGLHKWRYATAPYKLMGQWGEIRAKICKQCGYKSEKGLFIPPKHSIKI